MKFCNVEVLRLLKYHICLKFILVIYGVHWAIFQIQNKLGPHTLKYFNQ